jgi:hypothetical protein
MNCSSYQRKLVLLLVLWMLLGSCGFAYQASLIPTSRLIRPDELAQVLKSPKGEKPLVIQVGSHVLYLQAHIPAARQVHRHLLWLLPVEPLPQPEAGG